MRPRGSLARAVAAAGFLALGLLARPGLAEPAHRVVLLSGNGGASYDSELLTRLHAELSAAGFEVVLLPADSNEPAKRLVESAGRELNPAAVVLVRERAAPELGGDVAELWVSDRIGQRTLMQSMMLDAREHSRDMSLLAVQTVELVKARLAALSVPDVPPVAPRAMEEPSREAPPRPVEAPKPLRRSAVLATFSAGVGLLQDLRGMGATWAPIGHLGLYLPELGGSLPGLELRLSGAATAKQLELKQGPGSARASQAFGTFDARVHLAPRAAWHPVLTAGSGVYTVAVSGKAPSPYPTYSGRSWSGLVTAGFGLWAQPRSGFALVLDAQVLAAFRPTRVLIAGDHVGHLGAPTLFFSVGVVGVL